jgi:hypothetical protein
MPLGLIFFEEAVSTPWPAQEDTYDSIFGNEISTFMKTQILCAIASAALLLGCSEMRKSMGGTEHDKNVLTGGPVTGTTINDLPQAVKNTLKEKAGSAEIADIDKQSQGGRFIYRITFTEPAKNPTMYISQDGSIVQNMPSERPPTETEQK